MPSTRRHLAGRRGSLRQHMTAKGKARNNSRRDLALPHSFRTLRRTKRARYQAMQAKLTSEVLMRSLDLYGGPFRVSECRPHDADTYADQEIANWINGG